MNQTKISLDLIKVASPCHAPWDAMAGDDQVRLCGECSKHVYNLSAMTQTQAEALVLEREGKLCVRFYRRADGTMMTADCPVGWRAVQRRVATAGATAAAVVFAMLSLFTVGVFASVRGNGNGGVQLVNPIQRVKDWLFPPAVCVMGEPIPIPRPIPAPPVPEQK